MNQPHDVVSDQEMPAEIDFSGGVRGKFYRPGTKLNLPVYLDEQVQTRLAELANAQGVDFSTLVNDLLRRDLESQEDSLPRTRTEVDDRP